VARQWRQRLDTMKALFDQEKSDDSQLSSFFERCS
jgi:hypothetical protein